jgi:hypothetical protein
VILLKDEGISAQTLLYISSSFVIVNTSVLIYLENLILFVSF